MCLSRRRCVTRGFFNILTCANYGLAHRIPSPSSSVCDFVSCSIRESPREMGRSA